MQMVYDLWQARSRADEIPTAFGAPERMWQSASLLTRLPRANNS